MAVVSPLRADKTVVVRSVVDYAYAQRPPPTAEKVERYVFARGQYYNAIPMDRYLGRMEFRTLAATLAQDLRKSFYEPASSILTADLVLVVHWGVTQAASSLGDGMLQDNDLLRLAGDAVDSARELSANASNLESISQAQLATAQADFDLRNASSTALAMGARDEGRQQSNLELLGMQGAVYQEDKSMFGSALADALREMANEERYFFVIMAYDAQAMREGRKKRLWTTRASIRGAGVNFAIALDRMSGAAAEAHGKPQGSIAFETSRDRRVKEGKVAIGEITVLGEAAPPATTKKP
jgi:hypothetical protein